VHSWLVSLALSVYLLVVLLPVSWTVGVTWRRNTTVVCMPKTEEQHADFSQIAGVNEYVFL